MSDRKTAVYFRDLQTGKEPAREWLESLRDPTAQSRIYVRIARAENGNFGDHRSVGEGVMELRIPVGPGYRLYYALDGVEIILLLMAGDKSTQSKDIELAKRNWLQQKAEAKGD